MEAAAMKLIEKSCLQSLLDSLMKDIVASVILFLTAFKSEVPIKSYSQKLFSLLCRC